MLQQVIFRCISISYQTDLQDDHLEVRDSFGTAEHAARVAALQQARTCSKRQPLLAERTPREGSASAGEYMWQKAAPCTAGHALRVASACVIWSALALRMISSSS